MRSGSVIDIIQAHDIVLAQIGARLHFDQFKIDLAGLAPFSFAYE